MNTYVAYLCAFFAGIACKLYDDITDNHLKCVPETIKEALKIIHTLLYGLVASTDFNFAYLFYMVNMINAFLNPTAWTGTYEKACLYVLWIPCVLSLPYVSMATIWDFGLLLILIFGSIVEVFIKFTATPNNATAMEPPPDVSINKLVFRFIGVVVLLGALIMFPFSAFVRKLLAYILGYLIMSCLFQATALSINNAVIAATSFATAPSSDESPDQIKTN